MFDIDLSWEQAEIDGRAPSDDHILRIITGREADQAL
jgi:hypothetical protein